MITANRESNKHEQAPCDSCGFPYRDLIVYRLTPNGSAAAETKTIRVCRKCNEQLRNLVAP